MTNYEIIIDRKNCIKCGNCYTLDPTHFEPDTNYKSMVVKGETNSEISKGTFNDDEIMLVKQAAEECPAEVIIVNDL
ncbi:MAG: ferredoxin [Candidatus Heimdallarchaeota archaeon]|nr:ferredoxin [Candidatus Heimdallarchaeota archaeon]